MNDEILHAILSDYRVYGAVILGALAGVLTSARAMARWPAIYQKIPAECISVSLPVIIFLLIFFFGAMPFDWSGEFAESILCAFCLIYSLRLLWMRKRWVFCLGVVFSLFYCYLIYGTLAAWIARAENGHLFR